MVGTTEVVFCTDTTIFVELLVVGLAAKCTVFLPVGGVWFALLWV